MIVENEVYYTKKCIAILLPFFFFFFFLFLFFIFSFFFLVWLFAKAILWMKNRIRMKKLEREKYFLFFSFSNYLTLFCDFAEISFEIPFAHFYFSLSILFFYSFFSFFFYFYFLSPCFLCVFSVFSLYFSLTNATLFVDWSYTFLGR